MRPDAVVIGAGPAGSAAAIRLARSGRRVVLYEKSHFPRHKLCGGFLSSEGLADLEDLGLLQTLRRTGAPSVHRSVITLPTGEKIESMLPSEALSVSREVLDDLLFQEAIRSGVHAQQGIDGFRMDGKAGIRIIATGRMASVDAPHPRRMTPWYAASPAVYFGIQAMFHNVHTMTDQVELDLVESGYVGLARQAQGITICAMTTQDTLKRWGPSLDNVLTHFVHENAALAAHLKEATRVSAWMTVGPVRLGVRQLTGDNTYYVGDAACVVDPFVGEGMSIGLYSSQLLVRALAQTQQSPAAAYTHLWKKAFMPALRWNAAMRVLYSIPFLRLPALRLMEWIPGSMNRLTELTRYRMIED